MAREVIETSLGRLWVDTREDGSMRVWWPANARVGELAVDVLRGRVRWHRETHDWYVLPNYWDEVYEALQKL